MFGETEQERQRKRDLREFRYAVNERVLVRMSFSSDSKLLTAELLTSCTKRKENSSELRLAYGVFHLYMPYKLLDSNFRDISLRDNMAIKGKWFDRVPFKFYYNDNSGSIPYPATHREVMIISGILLGYMFSEMDHLSETRWIVEALSKKLAGFIMSGNAEMNKKTGVPLLK